LNLQMWPDKCLRELAPIAFAGRVTSLQTYYVAFVQGPLRARWTSDVASIQSLMDFKYYTEDTWSLHIKAYGIPADAAPEVPFDKYVRAIKAASDTRRRQTLTVAFLEEHALKITGDLKATHVAPDAVRFAVDKELEGFFTMGSKISKYVPLLKSPREAVELVANEMDPMPTEALTVAQLQQWATALGAQSLWPVMALWQSSKNGTIDETFLHAPLPRIFGAPSCVRNAVDRQTSPERLVKGSTTAHCAFDISKAVLAGHGKLAFKATGGDWSVFEAPRAHLVARLPGFPGRCIWALNPETREAAIYQLDGSVAPKTLAEFELPIDEVEGPANWIDCQRDTEGSIWLLWGRINALTGALYTQHTAAFDEEALQSDAFEFLETPTGEVPNRRSRGARIDYRDHGNLLSVHHEVSDDNTATERRWTHSFDVVFGNHLLMTLKTDSRPVEAVYGSPLQLLLLSPMSSSPLQEWRLVDAEATKEYKLTRSEKVPKTAEGWTSITVA
jgi:hypothetical protein